MLALLLLDATRGLVRAPQAGTATRTLWIDADASGLVELGMDLDDDIALAMLLSGSDVRVAGISTTYGNAPTRLTALNAEAVVRAMGMDVPVHVGAECTLSLPFLCAKRLRDDATSNASRALVEHLLISPPNSVTVVALGPLTNIAAALVDPRIDAKHAPLAIFLVGGTLTLPWERGVEEEAVSSFYFFSDPASLNVVMAYSLAPKVVFPTHALAHTPLNDATLESTLSTLCDATADASGFVGDAKRYFVCAYRDRLATERRAHRWASLFSAKEISGEIPRALANLSPKKKKRPKKKGVRDAKADDLKRFMKYRTTIEEARRGSFLFDLAVVAVLLEPNAVVSEWSQFPVAKLAPLTFDILGGVTAVAGATHSLGYANSAPMTRWDRDMYAKLTDRDFLLGVQPVRRAVEKTDYTMTVLIPTQLRADALRAWTMERLRVTELAKDSDLPGGRRVLPRSVGRAPWNRIFHWLRLLKPLFATRIIQPDTNLANLSLDSIANVLGLKRMFVAQRLKRILPSVLCILPAAAVLLMFAMQPAHKKRFLCFVRRRKYRKRRQEARRR